MCRAAKTPSTIAQQKAATTPKLMKTMEATNWKRGVEGCKRALVSSLFISQACLYLSSPNMEHFHFLSGCLSYGVCARRDSRRKHRFTGPQRARRASSKRF